MHGEQGEVVGEIGEGLDGSRAICENIPGRSNELSRSPPPPLPGGYKVGEKLYFIGETQTMSTGDRLVHGEQGEVMGPQPTGRAGW